MVKNTRLFLQRGGEKCSDKLEIFCKIKVRTLSGDGKITMEFEAEIINSDREVDRKGGRKEGREKKGGFAKSPFAALFRTFVTDR